MQSVCEVLKKTYICIYLIEVSDIVGICLLKINYW